MPCYHSDVYHACDLTNSLLFLDQGCCHLFLKYTFYSSPRYTILWWQVRLLWICLSVSAQLHNYTHGWARPSLICILLDDDSRNVRSLISGGQFVYTVWATHGHALTRCPGIVSMCSVRIAAFYSDLLPLVILYQFRTYECGTVFIVWVLLFQFCPNVIPRLFLEPFIHPVLPTSHTQFTHFHNNFHSSRGRCHKKISSPPSNAPS